MAKRSGHAESGGQDARRECPAMGHWQPRARVTGDAVPIAYAIGLPRPGGHVQPLAQATRSQSTGSEGIGGLAATVAARVPMSRSQIASK